MLMGQSLACNVSPIGGDSIGDNSLFTDGTGGFTAVADAGLNMGQPAILLPLVGEELLTELRVIVFGVSTASNALRFDNFEYHLDVWSEAEYFSDADPTFDLNLGSPTDIELVSQGQNRVVPDSVFGTSGGAGDDAATYELRFDLTAMPEQGGAEELFSTPLAKGDWVFGFQSWHNIQESGYLRVAGSIAEEGPTPLFSRDAGVDRGILGGQDPNQIYLRWGMSLIGRDESQIAGDFNGDGSVTIADYTVWRNNHGDLFDLDAYQCWKAAFGTTAAVEASTLKTWPGNGETQAVPEPRQMGWWLGIIGMLCLWARWISLLSTRDVLHSTD